MGFFPKRIVCSLDGGQVDGCQRFEAEGGMDFHVEGQEVWACEGVKLLVERSKRVMPDLGAFKAGRENDWGKKKS